MARWTLQLTLDDSDLPLFTRILHAITWEIRRGRLLPGDRLPGSRTLARQLNVHRNTVISAYDELIAQGWAESDPARGTFVARELPTHTEPPEPAPLAAPPRDDAPRFPLPDVPPAPINPPLPPGTLNLSGGWPDLRMVPTDLIARALRRALRRDPIGLLSYDHPAGHPHLRRELAAMLNTTRGLSLDPEHLLITRGSQMGIALIARLLLRPNDLVAVEALGYPPAWAALRQSGATLIDFPLDDDGLDVEALARSPLLPRLRAVYLTPHHQFPTLATLSAPRRLRLLELARQHSFAILEDDYDHEFHYDGRPVLPLAAAEGLDSIIYIGSLSKVLAPGLRVGYVAAAPAVIERLTHLRALLDRQGDRAGEAALAELLEEGEVQRHIHRARRAYKLRRDALLAALGDHLGEVVTARAPRGGMALWVQIDPHIDVASWAARALLRGVAFSPGQRFAFRGDPLPCARLGFAALREDELLAAARILAEQLPSPCRPAAAINGELE